MSFADTLLRQESLHGPPRRRQPARRTLARMDEGVAVRLKGRILEARGAISLNEAQVRVLKRLLERLDSDPFAQGGTGNFDSDDLEALGLSTGVGGGGEGDRDRDPFGAGEDGGDGGDGYYGNENGEELIHPSTAVTAPQATPDHDRDLDDATLNTMRVLQSGDEEVPFDQVAQRGGGGGQGQSSLAQMLQGGGGRGGEGSEDEGEEEGGSEGGSSPAAMASTLRKEFEGESAPRRSAPALTERAPLPQAPAPAPAQGEGMSWAEKMRRMRASHRGSGVNEAIDPYEVQRRKEQFKSSVAALRVTSVRGQG